jgi:phosphoribosylaminoimidazole-succinocarboxamide synthase
LKFTWALTLTLSRPTGEGTGLEPPFDFLDDSANPAFWFFNAAAQDSPSPIGWERAGVRVNRSSSHCSPRGESFHQYFENENRVLVLGTSQLELNISRMANETNGAVLQLDLPGVKKIKSGKVREMFDLGDRLLMVATDRISAFDVIMPNGIPRKGEVLTQISFFWFDRFAQTVPNHLLAGPEGPLPENLQPFADKIARRSMIVKKAQPLAIECVVRGYVVGSGWKDYKQTQSICGIKLPAGLKESSELPEPIFTPATKAESGHDENILFEQASKIVGRVIAEQARDLSMKLYADARAYARERGIIIADTKFEFGLFDGRLILIDEVLTPDSSRFWPADQYQPGKSQPSFDKQFVRDYLETLDWNKTPPGPRLPPEVVAKTTAKYLEAYERLTGRVL